MKKNLIYISLVIILALVFSNGSSITNLGAQTGETTTSDETYTETVSMESSFAFNILFIILVLIFPPLLLLLVFIF